MNFRYFCSFTLHYIFIKYAYYTTNKKHTKEKINERIDDFIQDEFVGLINLV